MLSNIIVFFFVYYSRLSVQMRVNYRIARKEYVVFSVLCDLIESVFNALKSLFVFITSNRIEPKDPAWINICQYFPESDNNDIYILGGYIEDKFPEIVENYSSIDEEHLKRWPEDLSLLLDSGYRNIFHSKYENSKQSIDLWWTTRQKQNILVYGKICPSAVIIKNAENINPDKDLETISRVGFRFMEVEYKCGEKNGFSIDIPDSHYISGNEILSKAYILRYLEHLPIYTQWVHNKNYILKIVDDDMNIIKLNHHQYIRLNNDGYDVIDVTTPEESDSESEPDLEFLSDLVPEEPEPEPDQDQEPEHNTTQTINEEEKEEKEENRVRDSDEYQMIE